MTRSGRQARGIDSMLSGHEIRRSRRCATPTPTSCRFCLRAHPRLRRIDIWTIRLNVILAWPDRLCLSLWMMNSSIHAPTRPCRPAAPAFASRFPTTSSPCTQTSSVELVLDRRSAVAAARFRWSASSAPLPGVFIGEGNAGGGPRSSSGPALPLSRWRRCQRIPSCHVRPPARS